MRWEERRRDVLGYITAVGSVLLALLVTSLDPSLIGREALFFAAVMITAYAGGLGPGLVATALAAGCTTYFFLDPGDPVIGLDDFVRTSVFIAVAVLISSLHARSRKSERELRRAEQEAVAANRAKDRFLAVISHELRNPLMPVLAMASLYERDEALTAQARQDISLIRRSAELESRLIEDLLDISRITAGKLSLNFDRVDVSRVIDDAIAICAEQASQKEVTISVDASPGKAKGPTIVGDPARLRQVLWNLLTNAVKFTPPGGRVTVGASEIASGDGRAMLELRVVDSGAGIAAEFLPHVFQAFEQGGDGVTKRFGGLGLGLAISKALVEAHGGSIEAHSEGAGRGSTFIVRLPMAPPNEQRTPQFSRIAPARTTESIFTAT